MDSVVDTFADTVLELPPRDQDHLLRCRVSRASLLHVTCHVSCVTYQHNARVLREEGMTDQEIANLFPPSSRQNPLLRQLMGQVYGDDDDDYGYDSVDDGK